MKRTNLVSAIFAVLGMLVLILDGKTAVEGAQIGIELCLKTVIPSLFPFFLLSILMTGNVSGRSFSILQPLGHFLRIPRGSESILISGFLGGYPVGAQSVAQAYRQTQLSKETAERMLGFCNNAGPAFLFGIGYSLFSEKRVVWIVWGIHILGALFAAAILPCSERTQYSSHNPGKFLSLADALQSALRVMATVSGWVILFRVIIHFLKKWVLWMLPPIMQTGVCGILELTNGCYELISIPNEALRFLLFSGFLGLGGICVALQTYSVTMGLSLRYYFMGKVLQTLFSLVAAASLIYRSLFPLLCLLPAICFNLWKKQKNSSIHASVRV